MHLGLKEGLSYRDKYGNSHNKFIVIIESVVIQPDVREFQVTVRLFSSLESKESGFIFIEEKIYNVNENLYDQAIIAIRTKILQGNSFDQAIYEILLSRPSWSDWRLVL